MGRTEASTCPRSQISSTVARGFRWSGRVPELPVVGETLAIGRDAVRLEGARRPSRVRSSTPCSSTRRRRRPSGRRHRARQGRHVRSRLRRRRRGCSGSRASPWHTTSRSISGGARNARGTRTPRAAAFATRAATPPSNGHAVTGSASCSARSPAPTARTAVAGSARHRAATALSPGRASVTRYSVSSSPPCSSTRGTGVYRPAHRIRCASAANDVSALRGPHLTYRPSSVRKVRPPTPLAQTGWSPAPRASRTTVPGATTGSTGMVMAHCERNGTIPRPWAPLRMACRSCVPHSGRVGTGPMGGDSRVSDCVLARRLSAYMSSSRTSTAM